MHTNFTLPHMRCKIVFLIFESESASPKEAIPSDPNDRYFYTNCFVCKAKAKPGTEYMHNYGGLVSWRPLFIPKALIQTKAKLSFICIHYHFAVRFESTFVGWCKQDKHFQNAPQCRIRTCKWDVATQLLTKLLHPVHNWVWPFKVLFFGVIVQRQFKRVVEKLSPVNKILFNLKEINIISS